MVFMIIRNKVKNMVNDVRYYFIDICLCLYLENEEKKTLPKNTQKSAVLHHFPQFKQRYSKFAQTPPQTVRVVNSPHVQLKFSDSDSLS